jgi:hypothetical protein
VAKLGGTVGKLASITRRFRGPKQSTLIIPHGGGTVRGGTLFGKGGLSTPACGRQLQDREPWRALFAFSGDNCARFRNSPPLTSRAVRGTMKTRMEASTF